MVSKNEFKYIQSLCHKKQRLIEGLFIAEYFKLVEELLNSNYSIEKIYATNNWVQLHATTSLNIVEVSEVELERMTNLQTSNEVLAIVQQKSNVFPPLTNQLHLLLDGIQDPETWVQ
jgi:TrmH family RNA methyltransferase